VGGEDGVGAGVCVIVRSTGGGSVGLASETACEGAVWDGMSAMAGLPGLQAARSREAINRQTAVARRAEESPKIQFLRCVLRIDIISTNKKYQGVKVV
jgi:hypothetical protein